MKLQGTPQHQFRLPSDLTPRLLSCEPIREQLGICEGQLEVKLNALCGVDALPVLSFATVLPSHLTHFSMPFLAYGPLCRSPWFRHLLCIYAGKDNLENMQKYLSTLMEDLFALSKGKPVKINAKWEIIVFIKANLLADLVALMAMRSVNSMTGNARCHRCIAGRDTRMNGPKPTVSAPPPFIPTE